MDEVEILDGELPPGIGNQIIIGFKRQLGFVSSDEAQKAIKGVLDQLKSFGTRPLKKFAPKPPDKTAFFAIALVDLGGKTLNELQDELKKDLYRDVDWAERNAPIVASGFDDPLLGQQWALAKLGADQPWTVSPPTVGGKKVMVALVDSGIRRDDGTVHADLGPVEAGGGVDRDGHGTCLAGTIAAKPGNAIGLASPIPASWGISVLSVPFYGPGVTPNAFDGAAAIIIAAYKGYPTVNKVINLSWHVAPGDAGLKALEWATYIAADILHCVVITAAGNDGTDNGIYPIYPANFGHFAWLKDRMLSVLASDRHDSKTYFSNFSKKRVDIAAPGIHILTTARYLVDPPRYTEFSGTSAAASYVSAGAALVFALNPGWGPKNVVRQLKASADRIALLKLACVDGKRLNLSRAVYGPLHVTTPVAGDVVKLGVNTNIKWKRDYHNTTFKNVSIRFVDSAGKKYPAVGTEKMVKGSFSWKPKASEVPSILPATGSIEITPTTGNFPSLSGPVTIVP